MHTCSYCGVTLPEGAAYCQACGHPVAPAAVTAAAPLPAAADASAAAAMRSTHPEIPLSTTAPAPATAGVQDYGLYALIRRDQSPLAQETLHMLDATRMSVHPRLSAYLAGILWSVLRSLVVVGAVLAVVYIVKRHIPAPYLLLLLAVPAVLVLLAYLHVKTTTITFEAGRLLITKGVFGRESQNIELYRVLDIALERSLLNRLTGDGTLVLTIEGIRGTQDPFRLPLTGLAGIHELEQLFARLRSLVLLLRTGPWGKGIIS